MSSSQTCLGNIYEWVLAVVSASVCGQCIWTSMGSSGMLYPSSVQAIFRAKVFILSLIQVIFLWLCPEFLQKLSDLIYLPWMDFKEASRSSDTIFFSKEKACFFCQEDFTVHVSILPYERRQAWNLPYLIKTIGVGVLLLRIARNWFFLKIHGIKRKTVMISVLQLRKGGSSELFPVFK